MAVPKKNLQNCISAKWKLEKQYCDVEVVVDDYHFPCHKFILSCCSGYFDSAFKSNQIKNGQIEVHSMSHETFQTILSDIYSGEASFTTDTIEDIWQATHRLDIGFYLELCETYVIDSLNLDNYCQFFNFARSLNSKRVIQACVQFMKRNFEVYYKTEDFLNCSYWMISSFVEDDILNVNSEDSVVDAILLWTQNGQTGKTYDRQKCLVKLLQCSKMEHASKLYLENLIIHPLIINTPTAVEIVHEALKHKWGHYSVLSEMLTPLRACSGKTNALVFTKENTLYIFDLNTRMQSKVYLDNINGYSKDTNIITLGNRLCFTCTKAKNDCTLAGQAHKCRTIAVLLLDENKNISILFEQCGLSNMPIHLVEVDNMCINLTHDLKKCNVIDGTIFSQVILNLDIEFESIIVVDKHVLLFYNTDRFNLNVCSYNTENQKMTNLAVPVDGPAKKIMAFYRRKTQLVFIPNGTILAIDRDMNNDIILSIDSLLWKTAIFNIKGIVYYREELLLFVHRNISVELCNKLLKQNKFKKITVIPNDLEGSNAVPMIIPQTWML